MRDTGYEVVGCGVVEIDPGFGLAGSELVVYEVQSIVGFLDFVVGEGVFCRECGGAGSIELLGRGMQAP